MKRLKNWFGAGRNNGAQTVRTDFDLLDTEYLRAPGETYSRLRASSPLVALSGGGYLMTRHADIDAAFTNRSLTNSPSRFSALASKNTEKFTAASVAANIPPFLDKPTHVPIRKALSQCFYDAYKAGAGWLQPLADEKVARLPRNTEIDLISEIAEPYVIETMAKFTGVPPDFGAIRRASDALFRLFAPVTDREAFDKTNTELEFARGFFLNAIRAADSVPDTALIARLLAWTDDENRLSELQIADNALLVLADGIENVKAGIASVLLHLAAHPEVARNLAAGATDAQAVVLECLRLSTPGQVIPRVVAEDTEICGHALKAGTPVFLALGSANLDPGCFDSPAELQVGRESRASFTFGKGRHRCLGEPLALDMIAAIARALLAADTEVLIPAEKVVYAQRFGHRWPTALPVRMNAEARPR